MPLPKNCREARKYLIKTFIYMINIVGEKNRIEYFINFRRRIK